MQSGEIKKGFGRCPCCRAMICQNLDAVIFVCSKCRTPIRGKNPEPADQAESRTELNDWSKEASVLDVDGDQPPSLSSSGHCSYFNANSLGFGPARRVRPLNNGGRRSARFDSTEQDELRPWPRRTRHPWSSDSSVLRHGVFASTDSYEFLRTRNACERPRQPSRRSLTCLSGKEPYVNADSATLHRDTLFAMFELRGLIAAVEPASSIATAAARRDARFFRGMESHLSRALLPLEDSGVGSSVWFRGGSHRERRRKGHCRPVMAGAPFVVCGSCFELLQTLVTTAPSRRRRVARLRCGGCDDVLELTVPATVSSCSAHQTTRARGARPPELPLHVALGYSSPNSLL